MNDNEIYQAAMTEWLGVICRLWTAVDKEIEPARLDIYRRELAIVPLGLLEKAISRCIRENRYNNIPSVGTIWQAIRKELGDPYDVDAEIERLFNAGFDRCVVKFERVGGRE